MDTGRFAHVVHDALDKIAEHTHIADVMTLNHVSEEHCMIVGLQQLVAQQPVLGQHYLGKASITVVIVPCQAELSGLLFVKSFCRDREETAIFGKTQRIGPVLQCPTLQGNTFLYFRKLR